MKTVKFKWMTRFIALIFLFGAAAPVYADQPDEHKLELTLHAGSPELLVDGLPHEIPAPYVSEGSTMVPLSVFTRVLGAELKLRDNRIITLRLPGGEAEITLNSKAALADGEQITLPAAPAVKDGLTFVPVRLLEWFGADIAYDPDTREIVVKVAAAKQRERHGSAIDSDAGKTGIGDSHYRWSMDYPAGLTLDYQSKSGDTVIFRDLKREFYLGIFIEKAPDELDADDRRNLMYEYIDWDETIVDSVTVPAAIPYDRITTKDRSGFYYEMRGMQANDYFYVIIFGKKASDIHELRRHTVILDSFKPAFDGGDSTIKNLAKRDDMLTTFTNKDYGLTISLPQTWTESQWVSAPYYSSAADDAYLWMNVTSPMPGDTLDDWVERSLWRFEHVLAEDYRLEPEVRELMWNDTPARLVKLTYTLDTEQWWYEYEIFAVHGEYRYYTEFAFMEDSENDYEGLFADILSSMKVDYETVEKHFGIIPDDGDIMDMTTTVKRTNRAYGYSITVPKYWKVAAGDLESDHAEFSFLGGSLQVIVLDDVSGAQSTPEGLRKEYLEYLQDNDEISIVEDKAVNFAGMPARKLVVDDYSNEDRVPSRDSIYLFARHGNMYVVQGTYGIANATDFIVSQLEAAIHSFTWTNP